MRLYNLTDKPSPKQEKAHPQTLRKAGIVIEPGGYYDAPKNFRLGVVSGWLHAGWIAVDELPSWYEQKKVEVEVGAMKAEVKPGPDGELGTDDDEVDIKPKPKTKKSKSKKRGKK